MDEYVQCEKCGEDFVEHELSTMTVHNTWFERICQQCADEYSDSLRLVLDEMEKEHAEQWISNMEGYC